VFPDFFIDEWVCSLEGYADDSVIEIQVAIRMGRRGMGFQLRGLGLRRFLMGGIGRLGVFSVILFLSEERWNGFGGLVMIRWLNAERLGTYLSKYRLWTYLAE